MGLISKIARTAQPSLGFPHRPAEIGGPGSFQVRLSSALREKGWQVVYPDSGTTPTVVLVVGGTAKLPWLSKCKARGAKIVHRLDGINWLHHVAPMGLSIRLVREGRNWLMRLIRRVFADHVVYQSEFVRKWWYDRFGATKCGYSVVYNGVDLSTFCPKQVAQVGRKSLLCVEGDLRSDDASVHTLESLAKRLLTDGAIDRVVVYGRISDSFASRLSSIQGIELRGTVPRSGVHEVFTNAVYLSLDVNPACPNSVIEALASGIPVVGFDTGALRELVLPEAGVLVPYGGDPWRLQVPDVSALECAARQVLAQWDKFSRGARAVAEDRFGLERMVDSYLAVFERTMSAEKCPGEGCG